MCLIYIMSKLLNSLLFLGAILATTHNIAFYKSLAERAREAILENRFLEFKKSFLSDYSKGK